MTETSQRKEALRVFCFSLHKVSPPSTPCQASPSLVSSLQRPVQSPLVTLSDDIIEVRSAARYLPRWPSKDSRHSPTIHTWSQLLSIYRSRSCAACTSSAPQTTSALRKGKIHTTVPRRESHMSIPKRARHAARDSPAAYACVTSRNAVVCTPPHHFTLEPLKIFT